ncbi:MAG: heavy metal-responsive transcriptional regulator [Actinomycetota bacterium]|nr:heavy metal-responsive transcriptional regulator [Actinomycetota bacterium]
MKIGELARVTGVSTKTIRYYEEIGVLPEPERADNGYRLYAESAVDRLTFVKDAQATGLSLDEIAAILGLRERGEATCNHVMHLLEHHLKQLDSRIAALQKTRATLTAIADRAQQLDPADCVDPNRCQTIEPLSAADRAMRLPAVNEIHAPL